MTEDICITKNVLSTLCVISWEEKTQSANPTDFFYRNRKKNKNRSIFSNNKLFLLTVMKNFEKTTTAKGVYLLVLIKNNFHFYSIENFDFRLDQVFFWWFFNLNNMKSTFAEKNQPYCLQVWTMWRQLRPLKELTKPELWKVCKEFQQLQKIPSLVARVQFSIWGTNSRKTLFGGNGGHLFLKMESPVRKRRAKSFFWKHFLSSHNPPWPNLSRKSSKFSLFSIVWRTHWLMGRA